MSFDYERHVFHSPEFQSVVEQAICFFNTTPDYPLPVPDRFLGSGVYGLYYIGAAPLYSRLARANQDTLSYPIYVGKAVPAGWRTGRTILSRTAELYGRLRQHARSIDLGEGLNIEDFRCRFMLLSGVEGDLVVPVEAELIRRYQPLWNTVIDGFGNHDPGHGRYDQAPSEWDVLHPGRLWVYKLTGNAPEREFIVTKVLAALDELDLP